MSFEFWTHARTLPRQVGPAARRAESEGWCGVTLGDSQNVGGSVRGNGDGNRRHDHDQDEYGVTNPLTRHPVVTASAIMSAHIESGGRVELGAASTSRAPVAVRKNTMLITRTVDLSRN